MKSLSYLALAAISLALTPLQAAERDSLPDIDAMTAELQAYPGYLPFFYAPITGQVLMEISRWDQDLLYVTSLPAGLGSNDIGLDRGQLGETRVVRFRRIGPKVLLEEQNLSYRADTDNLDEQRAVQEAFARSTLAGFKVLAQSGERALIDITDMLLSDSHGVAERIDRAQQGQYSVDKERSAPALAHLKNFPSNTVLEAWITLTGNQPGNFVRSVTPTAEALTLRMRHEFVALPEASFERRVFHPRSGFFSRSYSNYAAALGQDIEQRFIVRHRVSVDQPLVYYVDRGAPEPIRSALLEGASWWTEAFDAAGLPGAFQVALMPADADPMDVRINVIQWVHRSTRGWSYGSSVVDPRSGEILKGHVTLGSLRVRQDLLIVEGLTAPFVKGDEAAQAEQAVALARIRQLAAHEVGHTLGLAHNFAGSISQDASVMDYPHPYVRLTETNEIRLDRAYDTGIGEWDKLAIAYGYRHFPTSAAQVAGLREILASAQTQGLRFISDPDARGFATLHASAHLWDNGADPLPRLAELMALRDVALSSFSPQVLRQGQALSEAERKLVPIYLLHRYQAEAVSKLLGGLDYDYTMRNESVDLRPPSAARQRQALDALIATLSIETLSVPPALLAQLPPPEYGYGRDREYFTHATGGAFDPAAPARAASQLIVEMLLEPSRAQRLLAQQAVDPNQPGLRGVLEALSRATLQRLPGDGMAGYIAQARAWVVLREMQRVAVTIDASDQVRAVLLEHLSGLRPSLAREGALGRAVVREIERFLADPDADKLPPRPTVPPGSPI